MYSLQTRTYEDGRDSVLLTLDEASIRRYFAEWNNGVDDLPRDREAFWKQIHQAITLLSSLPSSFRRRSKNWLSARGYPSLDEGQI